MHPRSSDSHSDFTLSIAWVWSPSAAAAAAKSLQSCPTLCDPIDGSPPGFPVPGILQARTLEWVVISLSNAWKWKVKVKLLSRVQLFATPWTAAYQAPPSMGFSRQEYWSGVPLLSADLPLTRCIEWHFVFDSLPLIGPYFNIHECTWCPPNILLPKWFHVFVPLK